MRVAQWVTAQQGKIWSGNGMVAIGVEEDEELIAGVVYDSWNRASIHMHISALPGKNWLTRECLKIGYGYPFIQLGCKKVIGMVGSKNLEVQRFQRHLGYKLEATLEAAHPDGALLIYTLAREDCRWI